MPCTDITDVLQLRIDEKNEVGKYWLRKRSCGGAVGERSLIFDWLRGKSTQEILDANITDFLDSFGTIEDEVYEYLLIKHFFAVKSGVGILLGKETGTPEDFCAVDSISYGPQGTDLVAYLRMDVITDQIRSCGRCGSHCSTKH